MKFSRSYGTNIYLGISYDSARKREGTYNHGIVCSRVPLATGKLFQFEIEYPGSDADEHEDKSVYEGSVQFGLTAVSPEIATGHSHASEHLKGLSLIMADLNSKCTCLFIGGKRVLELPDINLRSLSSAGVMLTPNGSLHFLLNHHQPEDREGPHVLIQLPPCLSPLPPLYGVIDLYGRCSGVKLLSGGLTESTAPLEYTVREESLQHICQESSQREAIEEDKVEFNLESGTQQAPLTSSPLTSSDDYYSQVPVNTHSSQENPPNSSTANSTPITDDFSQQAPAIKENFSKQVPAIIDDISQKPPTVIDNFSQEPPPNVDSFSQNSQSTGVPRRPSAPKPCTSGHQELCWQFLKDKGLKDGYFDSKFHKCYCKDCRTERKDPTLKKCGDIRYAVPPEGWVKFGLRLNNPGRIEDEDLFSKGFKAYHGTSVSNLKPIVENSGRLYPPGVRVSGSQRVERPKGHYDKSWKPDDHDPDQIFLTPSIEYAAHKEVYAKTERYTDPTTGKSYEGKVCLKVLVEPGEHTVSSQTVNASGEQLDALFDNSELEWGVKVHTTVHIYGLLVRLVQV